MDGAITDLRSRRTLLVAGLGILVLIGGVAPPPAGSPTARATDPNDVVLGSSANAVGTATETTTADTISFQGSISGTGVYGESTGSGTGVVGENDTAAGVPAISHRGTAEEGDYTDGIAAIGIGTGEGVSVSVAWLPLTGGRDQPPRSARLVILRLDGTPLAERRVEIAPFTGATVHYEPPQDSRRRLVIGYVFIDPNDDVYATLEVYNVANGRTTKAMVDPTG